MNQYSATGYNVIVEVIKDAKNETNGIINPEVRYKVVSVGVKAISECYGVKEGDYVKINNTRAAPMGDNHLSIDIEGIYGVIINK